MRDPTNTRCDKDIELHLHYSVKNDFKVTAEQGPRSNFWIEGGEC